MVALRDRVLKHLSRPAYAPIKGRSLAKQLGIDRRELDEFWAVIEDLRAAGRIREGRDGRLRLMATPGGMTGIVKRAANGCGFLTPPGEPTHSTAEIFIAPEHMLSAMDRDEVRVELLRRRRRGGQRCGRVVEVLQRATTTFVGTYFEEDDRGYVRIDGRVLETPVFVGDPGAKGVQPDDKVVIEMLQFPTPHKVGEGVIRRILGRRGDVGVDTQLIIHEFGLPQEFPDAVWAEARRQVEDFDESHVDGRDDLTSECIVTIDPADARDFDDAISLTRNEAGNWLLGVHIADVAHFVPPRSALDREARQRGTSVYLPQHVIPMLPDVLSNGLASLQQGKLRFTQSVFMEFTPEGVRVDTRFSRSFIKVRRRFAYEQVLPIVENPDAFQGKVAEDVRSLLCHMHELAMLLRRRRAQHGALELDIPEIELDYDRQGKMAGAHQTVHDESHQIIEEFMLAANIAVAEKLVDLDIPFLRRVHLAPTESKMRAFARFCDVLGYTLRRYQSRKDLQRLLRDVQGEPEERAINYALLRSFKQAEYTAVDREHYALAVDHYCHFTSPIRRYPDLTIHRLFDALVRGRHVRGQSVNSLMDLGRHCSLMERRAEKAERELIRLKLLEFMEQRVGETLEVVVTGVEPFGVFCQGVEIPAEGLLHREQLFDDYWEFDADALSLTGRRSGKSIRLGDRLTVKIVEVDIDRREMDLEWVSDDDARSGTSSRKRRRTAADDGDRSGKGGKRQRTEDSRKQTRGKRAGRGKARTNRRGRR